MTQLSPHDLSTLADLVAAEYNRLALSIALDAAQRPQRDYLRRLLSKLERLRTQPQDDRRLAGSKR